MTLDSIALNVLSLIENETTIYVQKDIWTGAAHARRFNVQGSIKDWVLKCVEEGVNWSNSAAKNAMDKAAAGTNMNLTISEGDMHSFNGTVKTLHVKVEYRGGFAQAKKIRHFTLKLIQAQ